MAEMAKSPKTELPKAAENSSQSGAEAEKGHGISNAVMMFAKLSVPSFTPEVKTALAEAGEKVISLIKDIPGGIAALAPQTRSGVKTLELKEKVAEAAKECALGELSLSERKAYDAERKHRMLTGGKPGALEIQVATRSSEIMSEAYNKVDRVLPPGELKKITEEQDAIAKWDRRTMAMTGGARSATMPETPSSQFREQSVLDRLENHHVQKQKY